MDTEEKAKKQLSEAQIDALIDQLHNTMKATLEALQGLKTSESPESQTEEEESEKEEE